MVESSNGGHHLRYSAGVMVLSKEHQRVIRCRSAEPVSTPVLPNRRAASAGAAQSAGPAAAAGDLIGRVEIPRLLLSVVVIEGMDNTTLRRAIGHIPGTALPGHPGNVGLAGHRDTFFRPLKDLRIKDGVQFSTLSGNFKYEVESLRVVDPDAVGVLASSGENVLTLVTCYPFYYVGTAPKRFIVRARQVSPQILTPSRSGRAAK